MHVNNIIVFFLGLSMVISSANAQLKSDAISSPNKANITTNPISVFSLNPISTLGSHGCKIEQVTNTAYQNASVEQRAVMQAAEQKLNEAAINNAGISATDPLYITIPTVVHVVHDNGDERIGEYQITDAIDQVNEDMAALPNVTDGFDHLQANVGYTFKLAKLDPNGNPTNGITYTRSDTTYDGTEGPLQSTINWPREKYLNIWVVRSSDGSNGSGYSNYPSTVDNGTGREFWDGIVVSYWAMGRTGEAISTHYKLLTHEVGHWANLKHTWGDQTEYGSDAACNDDDHVSDTPNTKGNGGCGPLVSCGTQDNEQNFMDYGTCSTMYTFGQAERMHAAMQSSVADRNNLWTTENLIATGLLEGNQPPIAKANGPYYGTPSNAINFSSAGSSEPGGSIVSYSWNFGDGNTSSQANPSHAYSSLGSYNVTLTVTDDDGETDSDTTTANIIEAGSFITAESEPNNSSSQANGYVGPIAPVTGTISSTSDTDWFFFEVNGSGNINVRVDILGSYADLDMWVYHESNLNDEIIEGYTDDPSRPYEEGSFNATQNGIYFVHVDGWETETSDYKLKVTGDNIVGGSSSGGSSSGGSSSGGSSSGGSSSGGNELQNGVPVSGLSASTGNDVVYTINVPSGASNLVIKIEGGSGDADLYTRAGAVPTDSTYDCRPYVNGNNETCTEPNPTTGIWYARVKAYSGFSNVTLTASYDGGGSSSGGSSSGGSSSGGSSSGGSSSGGSSGGNELQNGVPVSGLSASTGNDVVYTINVPSGASNLVIKIAGGSGDADLYTRAGSAPTDSTYQCRPYINGNNETCTEPNPTPGVWYARVKAYSSFSNVTLTASFDGGGSSSGGSSSGGSSSGGSSSGGSSSGGNELQNGVPIGGLSASTGNDVVYTINVPSGASNLVIKIQGGSGDADLYTRAGATPTDSNYECRPYINGNNETCTKPNPSPGTWYARVKAYSSFSNVTLTASYSQ